MAELWLCVQGRALLRDGSVSHRKTPQPARLDAAGARAGGFVDGPERDRGLVRALGAGRAGAESAQGRRGDLGQCARAYARRGGASRSGRCARAGLAAVQPRVQSDRDDVVEGEHLVRRAHADTKQALEDAVAWAVREVTEEDSRGWIEHSGYVFPPAST